MFCAYCGKELPPDAAFCPYCGNKAVKPKEGIDTTAIEPINQDLTYDSYSNNSDTAANSNAADSIPGESIEVKLKNVSEKDEPTHAKLFSKTGLFNYRGRRSRSDYFKVGCTTAIIQNALKKVPIINVVILFLLIYVNFTNASKRLHDINKPTVWAVALVVLDFISGFVMGFGESFVGGAGSFNTVLLVLAIPFVPRIILLCIKGTDGPNQYGPDPLALDE